MVGHRALLEWLIWRLKSLKVNRSPHGSNKGELTLNLPSLMAMSFRISFIW